MRKDGSTFWAKVVVTAIRDPAGNLRGFAKVIWDLTSRRQVEAALYDFRYDLQRDNTAGDPVAWNLARERARAALAAISPH